MEAGATESVSLVVDEKTDFKCFIVEYYSGFCLFSSFILKKAVSHVYLFLSIMLVCAILVLMKSFCLRLLGLFHSLVHFQRLGTQSVIAHRQTPILTKHNIKFPFDLESIQRNISFGGNSLFIS